ncbi:unnamed protein product, partial [Adineta steineri]
MYSSQSLDTLISKDNQKRKWWQSYRLVIIGISFILLALSIITTLALLLKCVVLVSIKPQTTIISTTITSSITTTILNQQNWIITDRMTNGRNFHTATLLNNEKVLVTG